ncbi:hypothetical protein [Castellaniella ginsengisoli]|uniref:Uncharacterized protein n=1 Tax=Castellaniella ginsengisoli TaxID=546114 RepID=A0AB39CHJ1_9BURK
MIVFSTEFPVAQKNATNDILNLACKWAVGSPHSLVPESIYSSIPVNDNYSLELDGESITIGASSSEEGVVSGLRYRRLEKAKELEWETSIISREHHEETFFSIQVSCESLGTTKRLPIPKKPYFIKQVLSKFGGGSDGEIPISDNYIPMGEEDVEIASALINGHAENRLPIVYLSVDFSDRIKIDPKKLSNQLSGIAHVITEPSREFSQKLRNKVSGRNVYGGIVGIYWPQSNAKKSYNLESFNNEAKLLTYQIYVDLVSALANRRLYSGCTWLHLQEQVSKSKIKTLKKDDSSSVQDYINAFDIEIKAKDSLIHEANNEIKSLLSEIRQLNARDYSATGSLLNLGAEQNLYKNEIRDAIISTLAESRSGLRKNSRRLHIVDDIISSNPIGNTASELSEKIKATLRGYKNMDAKTRRSLMDIGFSIEEDGKHFKLKFRDDGRYVLTLNKTSSDHRAGLNAASDITNILF